MKAVGKELEREVPIQAVARLAGVARAGKPAQKDTEAQEVEAYIKVVAQR